MTVERVKELIAELRGVAEKERNEVQEASIKDQDLMAFTKCHMAMGEIAACDTLLGWIEAEENDGQDK